MTLDALYRRKYDIHHYNCVHFTADAWRILVGADIFDKLRSLGYYRSNFKLLRKPESPCIVVMKNGTANVHVGIYLEGQILHFTQDGVRYYPVDIASIGFRHVRYYRCL